MNSRRPAVPGSLRYDRVVRVVNVPGQYGEDCEMCEHPMACDQRVTLTESLVWVHLGCQVRMEQVKAGQLSLWS